MAFTNSIISKCNHTFNCADVVVEYSTKVIVALVFFEFLSAAFLCVAFVVFLTIRVKKKPWNTAAKRFSLALTVCSICVFSMKELYFLCIWI